MRPGEAGIEAAGSQSRTAVQSAGSGLTCGQLALQGAFERFSQASERLQAKYTLLLGETEDLRARLQEKDAEIARSARLAMLGETAAAIAHEVRNPLGSIKLFLSLLRQDVCDRPETLKLTDEIAKSISTLDNVVSNVLQFAKNKTPPFAPLNAHSIIQEQVSLVWPDREQGVQIVLDLKANPYVRGNECGLRQVFYNLLLNALQAVRYAGVIEVHSRDGGDGGFEAIIKDNGPGIEAGMEESIFEPFVSRRAGGTGLGLAIVKQIIEQHGGKIKVANQDGAIFTIWLPRKAEGRDR